MAIRLFHPAINKLILYTAVALVIMCALMQHAVLFWFIPVLKEHEIQARRVIWPAFSFPLVGWYVVCSILSLALLLKERWLVSLAIRQVINFAVYLLAMAWIVAYLVSIYQSLHPVINIFYS